MRKDYRCSLNLRFLSATLIIFFSYNAVNADDFQVDGIDYNITSSSDMTVEVTYSSLFRFNSHKYSGDVKIPSSVSYNGNKYSVTRIGDNAFWDCICLTSVTIPEGVTSIGEKAFWECSNMTSIKIPESVTNIGHSVFWGCSKLKSITIPDGITSIDYGAFWGCSKLKSITIPKSVTNIDENAFHSCNSLTSITIPESVTSIGKEAFRECHGLKSITISNGVASIGTRAFQQCSKLTSITIPESVTSIGDGAFFCCDELTSIYSYITDVFEISNSTFEAIPAKATLYVPKGTKAVYESTNGWNEFKNIKEINDNIKYLKILLAVLIISILLFTIIKTISPSFSKSKRQLDK